MVQNGMRESRGGGRKDRFEAGQHLVIARCRPRTRGPGTLSAGSFFPCYSSCGAQDAHLLDEWPTRRFSSLGIRRLLRPVLVGEKLAHAVSLHSAHIARHRHPVLHTHLLDQTFALLDTLALH